MNTANRDTWWIVYHEADAVRNRVYIEFHFEECKKRQISLTLVILEKLTITYHNGVPVFMQDDTRLPLPLVVINRSREIDFTTQMELLGCRVVNPSFLTLLGNNKLLALQYMQSLDIPVLKTSNRPFPYPCIMKTLHGHGGTEVFMLHNDMEHIACCSALQDEVLYQEPASVSGKDLRVYILGGKILAAMLRESDTDFRSNFCLGGKASVYTLDESEHILVQKIVDALPSGFYGIDFLFHNNGLVFNELEDAVGSRMLYQYTSLNPVALCIAAICESNI